MSLVIRLSTAIQTIIVPLLLDRRTPAEALFISPATARNHAANVLSKLGAANRGEAAPDLISGGGHRP